MVATKVLVVGRFSELAEYLAELDRPDVQLYRAPGAVTDPRSLWNIGGGFDVVVNCGAYANLNSVTYGRAYRSEMDRLGGVNGAGAANVAFLARAMGAHLIHVSSSAVFGWDGPYADTQQAKPIDEQGLTLLAGEIGAKALGITSTIIRFDWLYGRKYEGCVPLHAERHGEPRINDHVKVMPTHGKEAATALLRLIRMGKDAPKVVHVGWRHAPMTWYDFLKPYYPAIEPADTPRPPSKTRQYRKGLEPSGEEWTVRSDLSLFRAET